ncbi:MAG: radical SAM protein [Elusimicrobiota bacterium]
MKEKIYLIGFPLERYTQPMLGLGYVGASLLKEGHEIKLHDVISKAPGDPDFIEKEVKEFAPAYVGISAMTPQIQRAMEILGRIKKVNSEIITVMGGPHASSLPEYTLKTLNNLDYVITGEGEETFPSLIRSHSGDVVRESIYGLVYRKDGKIVSNKPKFVSDIDTLEYPWKIMNPLNYNKGELQGYTCKRRPVVTVVSTRGCPYLCTYCAQSSIFVNKLRVRNALKFVDEIEYLHREFGINEIQLADDNFAFHREHVVSVCNEIIKRGLDVSWALINGVRADRLDEDLLKLMKKAGCYYMAFGIEFGSERMLKICRKSLKVEKAYENIRIASRLGYITHGFFLMGYPVEKEEDMEATKKLIMSLPLDRISIGMPVPYPGSDLFNYYMEKKFKSLDNIDWSYFIEGKFKPIWEYVTGDYVSAQINTTYKKFYSSPARLLRFISKLTTLEQYKATFMGFRRGLLNLMNRIETQK